MGITRRTKALWDRLSYFLERQYWKVRKFIMSNIVFDLTDGSTKTVDFADLDAIHVKTVSGKIYISIVVKEFPFLFHRVQTTSIWRRCTMPISSLFWIV